MIAVKMLWTVIFEMMSPAADNHAEDPLCHDFSHLRGARASSQDKLIYTPLLNTRKAEQNRIGNKTKSQIWFYFIVSQMV